MTRFQRWLGASLSVALMLPVLSPSAGAQETFSRGKNVQPSYEGWMMNDDGSYDLVFGYFNRNEEEEPNIQVGPDNFFSPGPEDRDQPTHFYPGRQMFLFTTRVPADFGEQELVWTVTHNGRTDTAIGWLGSFYEITKPVRWAQRNAAQHEPNPSEVRDLPPSIELDGPTTVTVATSAPLDLEVLVKDDGLPGPPERPGLAGIDRSKAAVVVPLVRRKSFHLQDMVSVSSATETGLAVSWLHYRGPGAVEFKPRTLPLDKNGGRATTTAHFSEPGTYVLRAVADDRIFTTPVDVTVTVTGSGQPAPSE
jgi:hypothetical protein